MELAYLKPKETLIKLESVGREYTLRPINLEDESWIQETFGERLAEALENSNDLSRIIYRLIKDKSDFKLQEVKIIDEEGVETVEKIGGHKLLKRMISGLDDKMQMIQAFNTVLGVSRPEAEENDENESSNEDDKKKV